MPGCSARSRGYDPLRMAAGTYREITPAAIGLGVVVGAVMTAAFVYIGLKLGFGLPGSTVAAILGFALLRGVGRNVLKIEGAGSIVENNINQTIASGVNTASAGVVFTFPALFLLGLGDQVDVSLVITAAIAGSFMGIVIIVPLRKQMIEIERLRFPSGIAVATILKSPGAGIKKAKVLGMGFSIAVGLTLLTNFEVLPEALEFGKWLIEGAGLPDAGATGILLLGTSLSLSLANIGAGLLSGRGGLPFALGGVLAWWIVAPVVVGNGWLPAAEDGGVLSGGDLWSAVYFGALRPVGIGVLIGGALSGVVLSWPALKGAIKGLRSAAKLAKQGGQAEELPPKVLGIGIAGAFLALFTVALVGTNYNFVTALQVGVIGTIWLGLAGILVAQATGATDISPLSGLALIAVTLMLFLTVSSLPTTESLTAGGAVTEGVIVAVVIGVAVCVATNQCADMMQDLKTGHLIGGVPRRQQLAQFMVAWVGPTIAVAVVYLLWSGGPDGANGFGPGTPLPAPQADALRGMVTGVVEGNVPLDKYAAGTAIGAALAVFPIGGLGVLVGLAMYLPFDITLGYGIGCVTSMVLEKKRGRRFYSDLIVPLAAGFIVGEALTSLTLTMVRLVGS